MPRKLTPSQYRAKIREINRKRKRAVDKYNRAVRKHNVGVRKWNRAVRDYNAGVRSYKAQIRAELAKLGRPTTTIRFRVVRTSVTTTHQSYMRLEQHAALSSLGPDHDELMWLANREMANSLRVTNALEDKEPSPGDGIEDPQTAELVGRLEGLGGDLGQRYSGAIGALASTNPDSARHFCVSAREVLIQVLETTAPDSEVEHALPNCDRTPRGNPTRRSKIKYLLRQNGVEDDELEEFADQDIGEIITVVRELDSGAHGSIGRFTRRQLESVRQRVEHGLDFLLQLVG